MDPDRYQSLTSLHKLATAVVKENTAELEKHLITALEEHLGRVPTNDEVRHNGVMVCQATPDQVFPCMKFYWEGQPLLNITYDPTTLRISVRPVESGG